MVKATPVVRQKPNGKSQLMNAKTFTTVKITRIPIKAGLAKKSSMGPKQTFRPTPLCFTDGAIQSNTDVTITAKSILGPAVAPYAALAAKSTHNSTV